MPLRKIRKRKNRCNQGEVLPGYVPDFPAILSGRGERLYLLKKVIVIFHKLFKAFSTNKSCLVR